MFYDPYMVAKEKSREEKQKAAVRPQFIRDMDEALLSEKKRGKKNGPQ